MSDPRFARLKSDPRFRRPKKSKSAVVLDDRFKSILQDSPKSRKKSQRSRVDKYGRPLSDTHEKDNLRRFYRLEGEDDQADSAPAPDYARGEVLLESSDEDEADRPSDDEGDAGEVVTLGRVESKPIPVPADDEDEDIDLDEDNFADLDAQAAAYSKVVSDEEPEEDDASPTRRIAVVNLDWDHVRATHLYRIFSSVLSPASSSSSKSVKNAAPIVRGKVLNVRVYPSQFGKERMEREEKEGPPVELLKKHRVLEKEEINETTIYETGDVDEYDEDALRTYQLERYYYAIVECDNVQVASHLYSELQGTELERSANVFDLSFVPADMTFDDEDEATAADATADFKGLDFVTDALRHSKVKLTWDQDDPERDRVTRRTLTRKEIDENDFRAYIASSSESEPDDARGKPKGGLDRDKLRALLLGGGGKDMPEGWGDGGFDDPEEKGAMDMEVTFMPALSGVKEEDETTLGAYQRKMTEKRKKRKDEWKEKKSQAETTSKDEDDFFEVGEGGGSGEDLPASVQSGKPKGKGKAKKEKKPAQEQGLRRPSTQEELALLVATDKDDTDPKHFDMAAVIKAEKKKGRKGRKGRRGEEEDAELQEDFSINVKDDRFTAVHEDHTFAIDPSNPHFKKTKSMTALLEERQKRRKHRPSDTPRDAAPSPSTASQSLTNLVERVKRKSAAPEGMGKRRKL
ncbi:hypothetical protein FA95DRAFT_1605340 [Auriscalpium vulgare]|uniref:Uncharacterized protein n=1 Tax=Auriscalpium vulgare TaxID=40419 RepID=A0ACB8RWS8_9AGAM|nr:hypothetical protein FA95DRAFT_1605340 [Auriscalpium vulgare]